MIPFHEVIAFHQMVRSGILCAVAVALVATGISVRAQEAQLKTADTVLERYKQASAEQKPFQKVQSMTVHVDCRMPLSYLAGLDEPQQASGRYCRSRSLIKLPGKCSQS